MVIRCLQQFQVFPNGTPNGKEGEGPKGGPFLFHLSVSSGENELLSWVLLMSQDWHPVSGPPLKVISMWEWTTRLVALSLAHPEWLRDRLSYSELVVAKPTCFLLTLEGGTIAVGSVICSVHHTKISTSVLKFGHRREDQT